MRGFFSIINNFIYILQLSWKENKLLLVIECVLNIVRGPALLYIAYLEKTIIDRLVPEQKDINSSFTKLLMIILLTIIIKITYEFLMTLDTKLFIQVSYYLCRRVLNMTLYKIKYFDRGHFDNPEVKNIIYRGFSFNNNINLLISSLMVFLRTFVTFIASVLILQSYNKIYVVIALIIFVPKLLIDKYEISQHLELQEKIAEIKRKKDYYSSILSGSKYGKELRLFGSGNFFIDKYKTEANSHFKLEKKVYSKMLYFKIISEFVYNIFDIIIYAYLIYLAFNSKITIGEVTFIYAAFTNFSQELSISVSSIMEIYKAIGAYDFFKKFMNLNNKILCNGNSTYNAGIKLNNKQHCIEFINVSFRYPGSDKNVLNNISFKIYAGETVAIVGKNGSGKSTITKLLLRLYDSNEGVILIDNIDIKKYNPQEIYRKWGVLFQDYNIYSLKLYETIAFGEKKENYEYDKMEKSLTMSGFDNYDKIFTHKLETDITKLFCKEGYIPSGGQAQKLSLTKVFYFDAEMFVLDEPSAAIDAKAEQFIFDSMKSITKDKTTVLISHRLSNISDANRILVLEKGKIVENGEHSDLINMNGIYSNLYKIQSERFK